MKQPKAYILVGVPASGKSTWAESKGLPTFSSDAYIEKVAKANGTTYNFEFDKYIDSAISSMIDQVKFAVENKYDFIWDQTSTSVSSRRKKLRMIPDSFMKIAVFFPTPDEDELQRRLNSRPGKNIPRTVLQSMKDHLVKPTLSEGFDVVIYN